MKRVLSMLLVLAMMLACIPTVSAENSWRKEYIPDEFGDPTVDWFIASEVQGRYTKNGASGDLTVETQIGGDSAFRLFLDGVSLCNTGTEPVFYTVSIKHTDDSVFRFDASMEAGTDRIVIINRGLINHFMPHLYGEDTVKVSIAQNDTELVQYNFTLPKSQDAEDGIGAIMQSFYTIAQKALNLGFPVSAQEMFLVLGDFGDAPEMVLECRYQSALQQMETGNALDAENAFLALGEYRDAAQLAASLREARETPAASGVMSHAEYIAAPMDSEVCIETYVQAHQSWWDNKITVYAQSEDGACFLYNMACSEEDAEKLVPGTKIRVTGYKSEWSGEVEIVDASFEILDGEYLAVPANLTSLIGSDEMIDHQNEYASFRGLTVTAVEFKNGEPGDDIYVSFDKDGVTLDFCVEAYLTGPETGVYADVSALQPGDVVDVEGFLYWYNGANLHITAVRPAAQAGILDYSFFTLVPENLGMSMEEYRAAEPGSPVTMDTYVQACQIWRNGKVTVFAQSEDGACFLRDMACSEEDAEKLVPGTRILVSGSKSESAGEMEIVDAAFEILDGEFLAEPMDVTDLLGMDALIEHQNAYVLFRGLTVIDVKFWNGANNDVFLNFDKDGVTLMALVEVDLTGPDTEVHAAASVLKPGDVVDAAGFLTWHKAPNLYITSVTPA